MATQTAPSPVSTTTALAQSSPPANSSTTLALSPPISARNGSPSADPTSNVEPLKPSEVICAVERRKDEIGWRSSVGVEGDQDWREKRETVPSRAPVATRPVAGSYATAKSGDEPASRVVMEVGWSKERREHEPFVWARSAS